MANTRDFPSGARLFSQIYNIQHGGSPTPMYLYDSSSIYTDNSSRPHTGNWRPAIPTDFAANISLTGVTLQIGAVAITGIPTVSLVGTSLVSVTNPTNFITGGIIGITGTPNFNISNGVVPISGNTNITNGILPISGIIGVSVGSSINISNTGISNVTGIVIANYSPSTTVSNSTPSGVFGTILSANANRKSWFVQNNATGFVYLKFGTAATSSSYNMILKGSTSATSADGASFLDDGARWRGSVSATGDSTANLITWELT